MYTEPTTWTPTVLATETERNTESIERTTVTPKGLRVWMIYAPIMGGSAVILVAAVAILLLFFVGRSFRLKHQINNTMKVVNTCFNAMDMLYLCCFLLGRGRFELATC